MVLDGFGLTTYTILVFLRFIEGLYQCDHFYCDHLNPFRNDHDNTDDSKELVAHANDNNNDVENANDSHDEHHDVLYQYENGPIPFL